MWVMVEMVYDSHGTNSAKEGRVILSRNAIQNMHASSYDIFLSTGQQSLSFTIRLDK